MKNRSIQIALIIAFAHLFSLDESRAQTTAFTYQGRLTDSNAPVNGLYDLRFYLRDAATLGNILSTNELYAVPVTNGVFTVRLDFGGTTFNGPPRWMDIAVRTNDVAAPFSQMLPYQPLTAIPYALYAPNAGTAASASSVSNGVYTSSNQTFTGANAFNNPSNIFYGDFNGDGNGLTNLNLSAIGPAGTFTSLPERYELISTNSVGGSPGWITSADFDGDGNVDLVTIEPFGTYSILKGDGGGGFSVTTSIAASSVDASQPVCVVAGDVNGDNKVDLVFSLSHRIRVFTNSGDAVFFLSTNLPALAGVTSVAAADLNGDGMLDVMATAPGVIRTWTNAGGGNLVLSANIPSGIAAGSNPHQPCPADVNSDGKIDLIVPDWGNGAVLTLTNNGTGTFTRVSTNILIADCPNHLAAADFNQDGKPDFVAGTHKGLTVFTNTGNNSFAVSTSFTSPTDIHTVSAADMNRDGKPDVVGANINFLPTGQTGSATVFTNQGNAMFSVQTSFSTPAIPNSAVVADFDENGRPDIAVANSGGTTAAVSIHVWRPSQVGGAYAGDGIGLTNLLASSLLGTVRDENLSDNIVRLNAEKNDFTGSIGIGLGGSDPQAPLHVRGNPVAAIFESTNAMGTWVDISNTSSNGRHWQLISSGSANSTGAGNLLIGQGNSPGSLEGGISLIIQSGGNVGIGNNNPTNLLMVGNAYCDGSTWVNASDRNLKENFEPVDSRDVLEKVAQLPITRWNYKSDSNSEHLGPVAQDFRAAFGLGADDTSIATVDESGVALAAIQGLNEKVESENKNLRNELKSKAAEIQDLKQSVSELKTLVEQLVQQKKD